MRSLTPLRLVTVLRPTTTRSSVLPALSRTIITTPCLRAYKDDQDRESLKPRAPYGSQSDGDEAASHNKDAYDRSNTDPAKEKARNPEDLEVSGANQEINKPQGDNPTSDKTATRSQRDKPSGGSGGAKTKAGRPT